MARRKARLLSFTYISMGRWFPLTRFLGWAEANMTHVGSDYPNHLKFGLAGSLIDWVGRLGSGDVEEERHELAHTYVRPLSWRVTDSYAKLLIAETSWDHMTSIF